MTIQLTRHVESAEFVLPATELGETLGFFTRTLGFRIDSIFPADDPATVVLSGYGIRLRLERGRQGPPGILRLLCDDPRAAAGGETVLTAPNGTRVELVEADPPLHLPEMRPSVVISRITHDAAWGTGRAGMQYRDLIPDRQGGRFIASHIRVPGEGPVPDYVHFHKVRFQMIYCYKGWVRLVYEDQGEPFVMRAGDCVLQPPEIRHRVLESGDDLEVIEIGCPADHITCVDHDLELPNHTVNPDRLFSGQRFVRHEVAKAEWRPWRLGGFEARDLGIGDATSGLAGVKVARVAGTVDEAPHRHDAEFLFHFVLEGGVTVACEGRQPEALKAGDSIAIPAHTAFSLAAASADLEILEVALPEAFAFSPAAA
ncbi:MAG: cupin domain-containing protein [Azospirillaceae bacterium]